MIRILALALLATWLALPMEAQSGLTFTTTGEATALNYGGSWNAAEHTTESLDLIDWGAQKGNSLSVEGHEIVATPFNAYLGGVRFTPDLSALVSKTNLSADSFQVFLQGAAGVSTFSTAPNQIASLFGGGVSYRISPNIQWSTIDAHFLRVGSKNALEMSTGISYLFNPQTSKAMSMKRLLAKSARMKAAAQAR